jgi:hypothetical protein
LYRFTTAEAEDEEAIEGMALDESQKLVAIMGDEV